MLKIRVSPYVYLWRHCSSCERHAAINTCGVLGRWLVANIFSSSIRRRRSLDSNQFSPSSFFPFSFTNLIHSFVRSQYKTQISAVVRVAPLRSSSPHCLLIFRIFTRQRCRIPRYNAVSTDCIYCGGWFTKARLYKSASVHNHHNWRSKIVKLILMSWKRETFLLQILTCIFTEIESALRFLTMESTTNNRKPCLIFESN